MVRDEILEYPYQGKIYRLVVGQGDAEDTYTEIYNGVMDETIRTDDNGRALQTSSYVISIPLTKGSDNKYIIPIKGDEITLVRFDQEVSFVVDNAEPSQLGGVSIYATRKEWNS